MKVLCMIVLCMFGLNSCGEDELVFEADDLKISVETGKNWLHDFPLFMGIKVKNPPQFAVWVTDIDTNYIGTLFCTNKIAREKWLANKGNRRKEALPFWAHTRGIKAEDGLYLPTKSDPLADAVTGATPKDDYTIRFQPKQSKHFLIFAEFNHSTDFNATYPKKALEGTSGYSGGEEGSGQPALIYQAEIDLESDVDEWELKLVGHASPDGSDGKLYTNMEGIDSALEIVKRVVISRVNL